MAVKAVVEIEVAALAVGATGTVIAGMVDELGDEPVLLAARTR